VDAGSPEAASDALDLARDVYGPHPGWWFGPSYLSYAEGVLSWRAGRLREAILALTASSQKLLIMQAPTFAAPVLMDLADIAGEAFATAAGEEAATCLAEIAAEVDRPLFRGMAAYAKACVAMAAGSFREAGVAASAAAETFESIGYAPLRGRSLVLLARSRQDEDRVAAVALLQEAAGIFELAGAEWRHEQVIRLLRGFGTAGRRAALSGTGFASLTTREHEVAQLTTRHLTAQQIADVLVLSRRTIESHLASIYSKLNVHSKGELIRVFEDAENALVDA
jgi:DNA-binding CsgD family transcriptional regulator